MGNVSLPVARHFLSRELRVRIPGVLQASSPMYSCRSPGCHECFTAFIASHSCDCVLRDLMLKFTWDFICLPVKDSNAYVDTHRVEYLIPESSWTRWWNYGAAWKGCCGGSRSALPEPQQERPQVCWVIRCEGLSPRFMSCPWGAALSLQAVLSSHFGGDTWWFYPQHPLTTSYNASRNTWKHRTEQCRWHEEFFLPASPLSPVKTTWLLTCFIESYGTKQRECRRRPQKAPMAF